MQLVGGVVGATVGSFFGAPQLGWAIGSALGGMANKPPAPKVGSLAPTEVEYGWPEPYVFGTRRQSTWRLWQSVPTAHPVEAEKGSSQTVGYTYTCHMGLLICRRGVSALVRIWRNKELVAVFRTDATPEEIAASLSSRYWSSAIFYDGNAAQLPHPTYEAAEGTVPAYRGHCTLFIDDAVCEGTVPPAIEVEVSTGPQSSVGVELWHYSTNEITNYQYSPGSIGYTDINTVPIKAPQRWSQGSGTGYGGGTRATFQEAVALGESFAPGYIESTGETLVSVDSSATLVSLSSSGGIDTYSYSVSGVVLVSATPPVEDYYDTQSYPFTVQGFNPEINFSSGSAAHAVLTFDAIGTSPGSDTAIRPGSSDVAAVGTVANSMSANFTRITTAASSGIYEHDWTFSRYVLLGSTLWLANAGPTGDADVRRYNVGASTSTHDASVAAGPVAGLACDGSTLYVNTGSTIYQLSAADLTSAGASFAAPGSMIFCNSDGDLYCLAGQVLYVRDSGAWEEVLDLTGTDFDTSLMLHPPLYEGGVLYATQSTSASSGFVAWHGLASIEVTEPTGVALNTILSSYWQSCGIPASMIDLTETAGITVDGYTAEGTGKAVTDELAAAYFFETVNNGFGIKTVLRGQASVRTIAYEDCGVGVDDAKAEPIELDTDSAAEVPRRISLSAANGDADHQVMTESDDRILGPNVETRSLSLAISMSPERLKGIANTMAADWKTAAKTGKVALGLDHIDLELGEVVTLTGRGDETYRVRLVQESFADYVREFDWVLDRSADLQETGLAAGAAEPTLTVRGVAGSALVVPIDGPLLRNADDSTGQYAGADLQNGAQSAVVFQSADNVTYSSAADVTAELTRGTLLTSLRAWNGKHQWDAYSTFDVLMSDGGTLTSSTKAAMHADRTINACLIGSPTRGWELCRFVSASLIATDTYRVTTMLRAMGPTETLAYLHPPGETFILLRDDGSIRSISAALAQVGTRYWKAVPPGRTVAGTAAVTSDFQSIRTKSLSPTFLRCERDTSGNATFTWTPRTRLQTLWEGAIFPESEPAGTWRVEFFQYSNFGTAVRTKTVSTPSVEYTAAEQTADDVEDPARIAVRVRRISAASQVGYALEAIR